ncbi:MAG: hypothetical protein KAF40_03995 [Flavihumibacter sp.]|nr:hypothetical protein [Flavihumibacter sp.]
MTVKEALLSTIGMPVDDGNIDLVLIDHDLDGSDEYTKSLSESIGKAAIDVLLNAWNTPDVTEGGYSIKHNREAIKARLLFLANKYGRTDITDLLNAKPSVTGKSVW